MGQQVRLALRCARPQTTRSGHAGVSCRHCSSMHAHLTPTLVVQPSVVSCGRGTA